MTLQLTLPIFLSENHPSFSLRLTFSGISNLVLTNIYLDHDVYETYTALPQKIETLVLPFTNYFSKLSSNITVPHQLTCRSTFQQKVLMALIDIPYGETITYGELAQTVNTYPQAIGQALKSNPLPLIYPCHRVVSKKGIGGFMGQRAGKQCDLKSLLLQLEK